MFGRTLLNRFYQFVAFQRPCCKFFCISARSCSHFAPQGNSEVLGQIGARIESALTPIAGARGVFAARMGDGFFLDIHGSATSSPGRNTVPTGTRKSRPERETPHGPLDFGSSEHSGQIMYSLHPLAVLDKPSASAIISPGVLGGLVESCRSSLGAMKAKGR